MNTGWRLFHIDPDERGYAYDGALRMRDLASRMRWFLMLRWTWASLCLLGAGLGRYLDFPAGADYRLLLAASVLLGATNALYMGLPRAVDGDSERSESRLRRAILVQTGCDFLVLALVGYALGGIQSPVVLLFLAEISLVTLFCTRLTSLAMALVGILCALLPVWLEFLGWVPVVSLYDTGNKAILAADGRFVAGYSVLLLLCTLFFWYVVSEITASLRRRENHLEQAYRKISQLDAEKVKAMLYTAHELKAPLAIIKNFVSTLRGGYCGELPEKADQVIGRIGERSDLLMQKVVDIIHLSNLRTLVQPELTLVPLELGALLKREVDEVLQIARARGIEVLDVTELRQDYWICGSEAYLHTMISNLLQNAVYYSHDGGRVEVALIGRPDRVTLKVIDHGIGIDKAKQADIFEEHFRTREAVAHHPDGTGLGLPMVKEVARIHRASVELESEPGRGTEVSVTFALANRSGELGHGKDSDC